MLDVDVDDDRNGMEEKRKLYITFLHSYRQSTFRTLRENESSFLPALKLPALKASAGMPREARRRNIAS